MNAKEEAFIKDYISNLSDPEKYVFGEVVDFIRDNDGAAELLMPAHKAGAKSWGDAFAYILDNYDQEASNTQ